MQIDTDAIIDDIKNKPQTYNTMLNVCGCNNSTQHTILRRKLNGLCKHGGICKFSIPGTRSGQVLFYVLPKAYHILVEVSRGIGSDTYYFYKYEMAGFKKIRVEKCWHLKRDHWEELGPRIFSEFNVLKFL